MSAPPVSALVAAALLASCSAVTPAAPPTSASAALDTQTFAVGGSPWGVVADGEGAWVTDAAGGRVLRLAADGTLLQERLVPGPDLRAAGLVLTGGSLWVAQLSGTVTRLPLGTGPVVSGTGKGESADVAVGPRTAWLPGHGPSGALVQLDVTSLRITRQVTLPESPFQVELDGDELWVAGLDSRVFRLDAASGAVLSTVDVGPAPRGLALTPDAVWVSVRDAGELVRVDRATGTALRRLDLGGQPWPVAAQGEEVWVALLGGAVVRVDATSGQVTHRVDVPPGARGIALTPTAVWVTGAEGSVTRIVRPLRAAGSD